MAGDAGLARPVKNHVRLLRKRRKWTQAELAAVLGVSRQTINAIERGRYDPGLRLAFRIAAVFRSPAEDVFEPDYGPKPGWE